MAVLVLYGVQIARADINGSVSGIVTDPSGAVIRGVQVRAVNTSTGVEHAIRTDSAGFYSFPELIVGKYDIVVRQAGFKEFRQIGLIIDANSAIRVDVRLQVGEMRETVTVSSTAVQVETTNTQMGEVITSSSIPCR
jgi:hypothetical protein